MSNKENRIYSFPGNWQVPVRTEMYAFESLKERTDNLDFDYLAFPWATLIDSLGSWSSPLAVELLLKLAGFKASRNSDCRLVTVCQHIKCMKYVGIFKSCGVTDILWSHKVKTLDVYDGMTIYPFPLFPAQTFGLKKKESLATSGKGRKYLASFIGTYRSGYYLSDVRLRIFEDIGKYDDILIVERKGWHFERHVYSEQMQGITAKEAHHQIEEQNKVEYLDSIKDSTFSLCPTGSGSNSIRLFESIQLGSIPVILSKDLHLPGDLRLWEAASVIVEDSRKGYDDALKIIRGMSQDSIEKKRRLLKELEKVVLPDCYGEYILDYIR